MSLTDPELIRAEYASEAGLRARASIYGGIASDDARDAALAAVVEASPRRVLEVGCGWGEFAKHVARETEADVVALDLSPRMVALAREAGVDARVGDVQELPFVGGSFDVVVANWMLYHVPDLDRGLAEIARVLRPGGRLVAATNGFAHLAELWSLVDRDRASEQPSRFFSETGEASLRAHFAAVERRDVVSPLTLEYETARGYIAASVAYKHLAARLPRFDGPLVATRFNTIFVAAR